MSEDVANFCQRLYELVMEKGNKTTDCKTERTRDEGYVSGFRDDFTFGTLQSRPFIVKATKTDWRVFSLGSDSSGIRRKVEVFEGEKIVFSALQSGRTKTDSFSGADERFQGTSYTEAETWKISVGTMTPEILRLAPKGA